MCNFKNNFLNLRRRTLLCVADIVEKHFNFCLTENLDNSLRASKKLKVALLECVYASIPAKRDGGLYTRFQVRADFHTFCAQVVQNLLSES